MNVASLELCKELYELSGWVIDAVPNYGTWYSNKKVLDVGAEMRSFICPAYDLGYLLRKLPAIRLLKITDGPGWRALHENRETMIATYQDANTPEDAAAKLAIKLFKQRVLKNNMEERE